MAELLRSRDPVIIAAVAELLAEAGIAHHVADQHMSVMYPFAAPRVLIPDDQEDAARQLLIAAELGEWLPR